MDSGQTTSAAKVVLFARADRPLRAAAGRAAGVVVVPTAYEAAAELLAGPTAALVVELPLLTPYHCRLLRLAGDLGVAVLGVGAARRTIRCADLHPLRQVGLEELGERLAEICREFELSMADFAAAGEIEAQLQQEPPGAPVEVLPAGQAQPQGEPAGNAFLSGAAAAARREEELAGEEAVGGRYVSEAGAETRQADRRERPEQPSAPADSPPASPSALLSDEELSALLEDEP